MYKETNYSEVGRGSITEAKRSSQISEQLEIQSKLIDELAAVIDTLDSNLQSVSRSLPSQLKGDVNKSPEQLVPLADTLKNNNGHIISNIDRLRDMIAELEL